MGPKGSDAARLAAALMRRGASMREVLDVMETGDDDGGEREEERPAKKERAKRSSAYLSHERLLALVGQAAHPVTVAEMVQKTGATSTVVARHFTRAVKMGNVMAMGDDRFELTKAGKAIARVSSPEFMLPEGSGQDVTQDQFLIALRKRGKATAEAIRMELGCSKNSIRNHLARGEADKTVMRHDTDPLTFSVTGAPAIKRDTSTKYKKGSNDENIRRIFTAAGKPLSIMEVASDPAFQGMRRATVGMALYMATKRGLLVNVGEKRSGMYALAKQPAKKAAAAKARDPASDESAPDPAMVN